MNAPRGAVKGDDPVVEEIAADQRVLTEADDFDYASRARDLDLCCIELSTSCDPSHSANSDRADEGQPPLPGNPLRDDAEVGTTVHQRRHRQIGLLMWEADPEGKHGSSRISILVVGVRYGHDFVRTGDGRRMRRSS